MRSVAKSCPTLLWPHGLVPTRLLRPWDFPGKNPGVHCHFLLQGIVPTQGSNLCSPALAGTFFPTEPPGKPGYALAHRLSISNSCLSYRTSFLTHGTRLSQGLKGSICKASSTVPGKHNKHKTNISSFCPASCACILISLGLNFWTHKVSWIDQMIQASS